MEELLGELQIAFAMFVIGEHFTSLEHWKVLLALVSSAEAAAQSHPGLFVSFLGPVFCLFFLFPARMI